MTATNSAASNSCQLMMPGLAPLDVRTMAYTLNPILASSFVYDTSRVELTIDWPEGQEVNTYHAVGDFLQAIGKQNGADIVANAYALESGRGSTHNAILQHPDFSFSVIEGGMGKREGLDCLSIYDARGSELNIRGGTACETRGEGGVWAVDAQTLFTPARFVPVTFT